MDKKRLIASFDTIYLGSIEASLLQAGIAVEKRNEYAASGFGELPAMDVMPELWVDTLAYQKARTLLQALQDNVLAVEPAWLCPQCETPIEGQFAQCWQCGHWLDA